MIPCIMLSYPVIWLPTNEGVCAYGIGYSIGKYSPPSSSLAAIINAIKSSPITSAIHVVDTAIILGLYTAAQFLRPSFMFTNPPNTAASSVIESETQGVGSLKCLVKYERKYATHP